MATWNVARRLEISIDISRRRYKALALLVALVAAGVILEVSLRFVGFGSPVLFEVDARFGSFPKPNQHLRRFLVDVELNAFGMRSRPLPMAKDAGEYRILFVGDSVPYGTTYVDQKAIFSEQVVSMMERRHVTVMNAASPGWAPSNEFEFVKARGTYNADLVVFVYNTSDLAQPFSSYRPSPNTPLQNPPSAIVELWSRYIQPRIINTAAMIDNGSTASEDIPSGAATGMVLATISATRTYVQSQGAKFAILYSPAFTPGLEKKRAEWDRALNGLRRWVSVHDVPFLDMSTVIKPEKVPSLYFDRIHLRPSGDRLMAQNFVGWFDTLPR